MLKIPKIVETILNEYEGLFNEYLPNELEGLYLHGSIALDAFEKGKSDIDFISVTSRHFTEDEAGILSKIHRMIAQKYKTPEMDGVYITWGDLGKVNNDHQNHFYYNSGNLSFGPYFNFNPVTWSLFAKKGITVLGPASSDFELEFHPKQLQSYVFANMNTYWGDIRDRLVKDGLFGDKVEFLTVTIDPARDTLPIMKEYGETFKTTAADGWYVLRGDAEDTRKLADAFRFQYKDPGSGFLIHTNATYLINEKNRVIEVFGMGEKDFDREEVYKKIVKNAEKM